MAYASDHYYDVFLNHRGPDVKKGFAGHLYHRLCLHGVRVFLDKEEMQEGDNLNFQIVGAIKTASVQVAIFSENYAESNWCLLELVLMLESLKSGAVIIPIFYGVKPAALRWTQGGDGGYAKDLRKLEDKTDESGQPRYDEATIKKWREALSQVADISGFDLEAYNWEEGELVEKIVEHVLKKVKKSRFSVPKYDIGLDVKVKDFEDKVLPRQHQSEKPQIVRQSEKPQIVHQSEKPQIVGIVGLGGVGKTTLAKEVFHKKISSYFNSCFFTVSRNARIISLNSLFGEVLKRLTRSDVQVNSVSEVKKKFEEYEPSLEMIQKYNSLVILDGVDNVDQLNALLPIQEVLHPSSLILITSRDRDVLTSSRVEEASIYRLNGLNTQYSRKLFCSHAFHRASPLQGYEYLVDEFLTVCDGLPLSLEVLGAFFYGKNDRSYWEDQLDRFQQILPYEIEKKLKFSFDALNIEEQQIFLDIAHSFIGERTDTAIRIWKGYGWRALLGFQSLLEKRLVQVDSENCIYMHDHLKDLSKTIAEETRLPRRRWPLTDNNADLLQESPVITELQRNVDDLVQQHSSVITELQRNMDDLVQQHSSVITELQRNIDDLLQQHSSEIKQVRSFMRIIRIMMIILIIMMVMAMMIWAYNDGDGDDFLGYAAMT